jgi:hypothetical protein
MSCSRNRKYNQTLDINNNLHLFKAQNSEQTCTTVEFALGLLVSEKCSSVGTVMGYGLWAGWPGFNSW